MEEQEGQIPGLPNEEGLKAESGTKVKGIIQEAA